MGERAGRTASLDGQIGPPQLTLSERKSFPWLVASYWLHLLLPLFLLADVLQARRLQMQHGTDDILGILSCLWLFAASVCYVAARDRAKFLNRARGPLLSFYAVVVALAMVEVGLHVFRQDLSPAIWRPGLRLVFTPDPHIFPGVSKVTHFRANEFGLRGVPLPGGKGVYKIIAVGASTTLCLMLDDQATWPQQLMNELNQRQNKLGVWIANAGVSSQTAIDNLVTLRSLPIVRQANLVVLLVGINDFQDTLGHAGEPTQTLLEEQGEEFRRQIISSDYSPYPLYRRLRIYRFLRRATDLAIERSSQADNSQALNENRSRQLRFSRPTLPLPDLSIGLMEYRKRLEDLASECRQLNVRCLFATQPSMWRPDLPPQMQDLLTFGWLGPKFEARGYASIPDLEKGMDLYNQVMLDVCKETGIECYDLASRIPKNISTFYDDDNFTEGGARFVADSLTTYLLSRPPFSFQATADAVRTLSAQ